MKKHYGKILISLFVAALTSLPMLPLVISMDSPHMWRAMATLCLIFSFPVAVAVGDVMYCSEYLYKNRGNRSSLKRVVNAVSLVLSVSAVVLSCCVVFEPVSPFSYIPTVWMLSYPVFRIVYARVTGIYA